MNHAGGPVHRHIGRLETRIGISSLRNMFFSSFLFNREMHYKMEDLTGISMHAAVLIAD